MAIKLKPLIFKRGSKRDPDKQGTIYGASRIGVKKFRPSVRLPMKDTGFKTKYWTRTLVVDDLRTKGKVLAVAGAPLALKFPNGRVKLYSTTQVNLPSTAIARRIFDFCDAEDPTQVVDQTTLLSPYREWYDKPDRWLLFNAAKYTRKIELPSDVLFDLICDKIIRDWGAWRLYTPINSRTMTIEWANRMVTYLCAYNDERVLEFYSRVWIPWMTEHKLFLDPDTWIGMSSKYENARMVEVELPDVKARDIWMLSYDTIMDLYNRIMLDTGLNFKTPKLFYGGAETPLHEWIRKAPDFRENKLKMEEEDTEMKKELAEPPLQTNQDEVSLIDLI